MRRETNQKKVGGVMPERYAGVRYAKDPDYLQRKYEDNFR